eukprot:1687122-Lingulodinium_polyedra.AAC.1
MLHHGAGEVASPVIGKVDNDAPVVPLGRFLRSAPHSAIERQEEFAAARATLAWPPRQTLP